MECFPFSDLRIFSLYIYIYIYIYIYVDSAFKEGTQYSCNAQDRFSAKFQANYASSVHKNEQLGRSLEMLHSQMDFLQELNRFCLTNSTYLS